MALELVGAVGIKVRPDADGFREAAKREILSELNGLEAEVKVKVDPKVERERVKGLFEKAFGDLETQTVDQRIRVNPIVEKSKGKTLEQLLKENMPDVETTQRIRVDTDQARKDMRKLGDEMENLDSALSRTPHMVDALDKELESTLHNLEKNMHDAEDRVNGLEDAIGDLGRSQERNDAKAKASKAELVDLEKKLKDTILNRGKAEAETQALREKWRQVRGKEAKAEVAAERNASAERAKALAAEQRALEARQRATQKALDTATKAAAKDAEALTKKNELLAEQWRLTDDLLKMEEDSRKKHAEGTAELKEQEKYARKRLKAAQAELHMQESIVTAMSKTTEQLRETAYEFDPILNKEREWFKISKHMHDPSLVTGYYRRLAKEHSSMTHQQIADLQEYEKRQRVMIQHEIEAAKQAANLRKVFTKVQGVPSLDNLNSSIAKQVNSSIGKKVLWIDPRLDKDGLKRQLADLEHALGMAKAGDLKLNPIVNERVLNARINQLRRRVEGMPPVEIPFVASTKNFLKNQKGWLGDSAKAVAGLGIYKSLYADLKRSAAEMDTLAIATARVATKLTALGGVALAAGGSVAHVGADISKLAGGLLMVPSLMFTAGSAIYSLKKGFEGFGKAVAEGEGALGRLPDPARKAAMAIHNLLEELDSTVQDSMWKGVGNSMAKAVDAMHKPLVKGLNESAKAVGEFIAGMSRSFQKFAQSGMMDKAFQGMNKGLHNLAGAAEPLFDAINRIGAAGARHLPALGKAAADAANQFARWSKINDENGNFDKWIKDAATSAKQLGSVLGSTVGILRSVGHAAAAAGLPGLGELAKGMELTNQAAKGSFFQGHFTQILRGAGSLAGDVGQAFGKLGRAILEQSDLIEHAMERTGQSIKTVISAIANNLGNVRLNNGFKKFFDDINEAAGRVADSMPAIMGQFGDFAGLAGELVKAAAKIGQAFIESLDASSNLTTSLTNLVPVLADLVAGFITMSHTALRPLVDTLAGVIDIFVGLPGPMQAVIGVMALLATGAFKLGDSFMRSRTGMGLMANAMDAATSKITGHVTVWQRSAASIDKAEGSMRRMRSTSSGVGSGLDGAGRAMQNVGTAATTAGGHVERFGGVMSRAGGFGRNMVGGLSSLVGFLGGPWGVAFAVAGTAMAVLGAKSAEAAAQTKQNIESIKPTLDSLGNATSETVAAIANNMNDMETSFHFSDWIKDEADTVGEAFQRLGTDSTEMANMLRTNRGAFDDLATAMEMVNTKSGGSAEVAREVAAAQQQVADHFGVSTDVVRENANAISDAGSTMKEQASAYDQAADSVRSLGDKMSSSSGQTEAFNAAMEALSGKSGDAASNVSKLSSAIDKYNGGTMSAAESAANFGDSLRSNLEQATQFGEKLTDVSSAITDGGTNIDAFSEKGSALQSVLKSASDASLEYALSLRDQGASQAEINSALDAGKQNFIQAAGAMGVSSSAAGKLYDSMAKIPDEIKKQISVEGVDESVAAVETLGQELGVEFDGKEYKALLNADPAMAKAAKEDAVGAARAWADSEYKARFGIEASQARAVMQEALNQGRQWDGKSFNAWLKADPENAKLAATDAKAAVDKFYQSDQGKKLRLDADTSAALAKLNEVKAKINEAKTGNDLKATLTADSANFDSVLARAKQMGMEIRNPDKFKAFITANADDFMSKHTSVEDMIKQFNTEQAEAKLKADDTDVKAKTKGAKEEVESVNQAKGEGTLTANGEQAKGEATEVKNTLDEIDGKNASADVTANTEAAKTALAQIDGQAKQWDGQTFRADLDGNQVPFIEAANDAGRLGMAFDGERWNAVFDADSSGAKSAADDAKTSGEGWDGSKYIDAQLGARSDLVAQAVANANAAAEPWNGKYIDAQLGARSDLVAQAVANAIAAAAPWDGKIIDAQLGARSERVAGAVANAIAAATPWTTRSFDAQLGARSERVGMALANAAAAAAPWTARTFDAQLGARSERVAGAVANANAIASAWVGRVFDAQLGARTERVDGALANARARGAAWQGSSFDAQFGARTERVDQAMANARARGAAWQGSSFDAQFGGRTERVDQAKANADARGWHWMGSNFDAQFGARIGGVYSALNSAMAAGNSWASRVFTATFNARHNNADGGLYGAFADGGFMVPANMVKAFANGGTTSRESRTLAKALSRPTPERHTAQIATPRTPFRVWAEPETGGESYIPLASSKRARSTKIWEETGNRLGVSWAKYANGGTTTPGAARNKNAVATGSTGPKQVINVTNHYPQAEPASVTINRGLQLAGAL